MVFQLEEGWGGIPQRQTPIHASFYGNIFVKSYFLLTDVTCFACVCFALLSYYIQVVLMPTAERYFQMCCRLDPRG
jgi:hypothetical protein